MGPTGVVTASFSFAEQGPQHHTYATHSCADHFTESASLQEHLSQLHCKLGCAKRFKAQGLSRKF